MQAPTTRLAPEMAISSSGEAQALLCVDGLMKSYGRHAAAPVLQDVSFTVDHGETLALVGESGAGKSTIGRCIVRLVEPTSGRVVFDGVDIAHLGQRDLRGVRRRLQMIFQDPASSLDPHMTILQAVAEPLRIHKIGEPRDRPKIAAEALERVGLTGRLINSKPHLLSGGQQQRVAIARALVTNPALIVLDEPVSALDVSVRAQVLNVLDDLQRDTGVSYLFIVHDLALAESFSDRIMVLYGGQVMEYGPAESFFSNPAHPYTAVLASAVLSPDPRRRADQTVAMVGESSGTGQSAGGCALAARCPIRAGRARCEIETPRPTEISACHWSACHFIAEACEFADRSAGKTESTGEGTV